MSDFCLPCLSKVALNLDFAWVPDFPLVPLDALFDSLYLTFSILAPSLACLAPKLPTSWHDNSHKMPSWKMENEAERTTPVSLFCIQAIGVITYVKDECPSQEQRALFMASCALSASSTLGQLLLSAHLARRFWTSEFRAKESTKGMITVAFLTS